MKSSIVAQAQSALTLAQSNEQSANSNYRTAIVATQTAAEQLGAALSLPDDAPPPPPPTPAMVLISSTIPAVITHRDLELSYEVTPESPVLIQVGHYSWSGQNGSYSSNGSGYIGSWGKLSANGDEFYYLDGQ